MRIFAGVALVGGVKPHWGLSTTAIFWRIRWLRLRKLSEIRQAVICDDMLPLVDRQMNAK